MTDNRHGSLVILDTHGVLITGPSGTGKSALALDLVDHWTLQGRFALLVSDDRVLCRRTQGGRVVGRAPEPIAGMIEVRGFGIRPVRHEAEAVIDLIVDLVPPGEISRMPQRQVRDGIEHIAAPAGQMLPARQLVAAALERLESGV